MGKPSAYQRTRAGGIEIRTRSQDLHDLLVRLKDLEDGKLAREIRKSLKAGAEDVRKAMRDEVLKPPPAKVGGVKYGVRTYRSKKTGKTWTRKVIVKTTDRQDETRSRSRGTRRAIARSLRVSMLKGSEKRGGSVKIVANANLVPGPQQPMVKAYNSGRPFRHPVFADAVHETSDQWTWVYQRGRPYFGSIAFREQKRMERRLREAMLRINRQLGAK